MIWLLWLFFLLLSTAVFAAGVVFACIFSKKSSSQQLPFYIFAGGVFLSILHLVYPEHLTDNWGSLTALINPLFVSLQNTFQFFTVDASFSEAFAKTAYLPGWLEWLYTLHGSVLIVLAPVLTFGFALSFFKGARDIWKYRSHAAANTYLFSQVNPHAVALAESVRGKEPDAILIFTNVPQKEDALDDDLAARVHQLDALCTASDISLFKLKKNTAGKKTFFFVLCEDESESTAETLQLISKYRDRADTEIYLFSTSIESELILNNVDKGLLIVRRIDPRNSFVNHTLATQGKLLFDSAIANADGTKDISALILGGGHFGTTMLKALTWYCQMDGYRFQANIFDKDATYKDRLTAQCPELLKDKYNGVYLPGEAYYKIDVHQADVDTQSFRQKIRDIGKISFAFVALGNDHLNVSAAVNLRILFEQMRIHPVIMAVVSSPEKHAALQNARDRNGTSYDIRFVGDDATVYSAGVIMNPELEDEAMNIHKRYNGDNPYGFYEFEYNYKSSMASALHDDIRKLLGIPGAGKPEDTLTQAEKDGLASLEHRRWNAYMRSEGFIYSGSKDKKSRNDLGKMHHNLVDYSQLSDDDKRKDIRVGTTAGTGV